MSDVTLFCPACNRKLRVPESELGQTVQCPLCSAVFTAPVRMAMSVPATSPSTAAGTQTTPGGVLLAAPSAAYPAAGLGVPPTAPAAPRRLLLVPAIGLLLIGLFQLALATMFVLIFSLRGAEGIAEDLQKSSQLVPWPPLQELFKAQTPQEMLQAMVILLFVALLTVLGAVQMLRLRMYWLALLGGIAGVLNVQSCCCLLPLGLWSLVVLLLPEVRNAFK